MHNVCFFFSSHPELKRFSFKHPSFVHFINNTPAFYNAFIFGFETKQRTLAHHSNL
jgi:hypothetical protein